MGYLSPFFFGGKKKEKKNAGKASGWACGRRVQNFKVYISKTAWTIGVLCVKMSKVRYFLQMTSFWCRIQFFRQILLNVEYRQVRFSIFCAKISIFYRHALEYVQPIVQNVARFFFRPRREKVQILLKKLKACFVGRYEFRS